VFDDGLLLARKILLQINQMNLAIATEFVDTITPQYISELVSWVAIGARTTESQPHRMLASGLSMPVGFKNNTAGSISSAVNAAVAASHPHRFLSVTEQGIGAIVVTKGNNDCHIVLRGGDQGPNYSAKYVAQAKALLEMGGLNAKVIVDCSHDNSNKDYQKQVEVIQDICEQLQNENHGIMGLMIESNLVAGKQKLQAGAELTYGQSITDGCIDWQETESLLRSLADRCPQGGSHERTVGTVASKD
jgi:3-deoxy-7-phosphoheptulonate synthase